MELFFGSFNLELILVLKVICVGVEIVLVWIICLVE